MRQRNIDSARYTRKVIKEVKAMMMEMFRTGKETLSPKA